MDYSNTKQVVTKIINFAKVLLSLSDAIAMCKCMQVDSPILLVFFDMTS